VWDDDNGHSSKPPKLWTVQRGIASDSEGMIFDQQNRDSSRSRTIPVEGTAKWATQSSLPLLFNFFWNSGFIEQLNDRRRAKLGRRIPGAHRPNELLLRR
jgi:hypothetical protein